MIPPVNHRLPATSARDLTPPELQALDRDGVVCVRGVLDQEWVERVRRAVDGAAAEPTWSGRYISRRKQGLYHDMFVWLKNDRMRELWFDSPLAHVAGQAMRSRRVYLFGNPSSSRGRRAIAFRFTGDDARYDPRPNAMPVFWKHGPTQGDPMGGPLFPELLPNPPAHRGTSQVPYDLGTLARNFGRQIRMELLRAPSKRFQRAVGEGARNRAAS
ncbi:phytanoyl-CoA dioxygenase family protein [Streptomyces halobius]|uniref:Uncharacterized protein n=1 Tax=Streptomyces halobius TaxID=2879846 RepID=A0ABY4MHL3_9ACTN|nr:hypothetical protein [Streptomyces halobius]UQA97197.1 hypothetical protein K9S39_39795 [Streptomyces halobius]